MLNLVKMDLYRFFRSKSLIIMIVICLFAAAIYPIGTKLTGEAGGISINFTVGTEETQGNDTVVVENTETDNIMPMTVADQFESICCGESLMLFVAIFMALFVSTEQKNGFIKNIAGQQKFRGSLIGSKIVVAAVFVAVIFISTMIFMIATTLIIYEGNVTLGFDTEFFKVVGVQYLLHFALAMLIIFLCTLTRSSALSMTLGVLIPTGVFVIVYMLITMLVNKIDGLENFNLTDYVVECCTQAVTSGANAEVLTRSVIVAVAYAVISGFVAVLLMQKRDVK